ncbi:CpsD/CapB family tyrosine-protein kinase [Lysinibacillus piscis]|uniref:non-specific protein-tyrosine kinase n=1 Tax=Lysinibacillus piscis TaxID=2518931 RepID=A0ABQ5NH04_9BACI|nr:CpsD/CapB family tyrosine-protein kinase [Lysinibacillus sp. KH24]GLC87319.1 tyrosine-protein kinase YwqD [Lysinibacillus sp. KH24]
MARKLITISDAMAIPSEQFRTIRTNMKFLQPNQEIKTITVTSAISGEGKTTNVANLAVVFAQEGKKVLLVDADMRKPTLHHTFYLDNDGGLSTVLARQQLWHEAVQQTSIDGLDMITSGPIPPNPMELLATDTLTTVVEEMKATYDIVLFDVPPLLFVADAQIIANLCDGTILVIGAGAVHKKAIVKAKSILTMSQATILGTVLNNVQMKHTHYDQYSEY